MLGLGDNGAVLDQLRVTLPAPALAPAMLREIDLVRFTAQCRLGRGRVEVELDHLPVAFMLIAEVVEGVEQPILDCELARTLRIAGHVRVDRRPAIAEPGLELLLIAAPRPQGLSGEIDVIARRRLVQVLCRRSPLDDPTGGVPKRYLPVVQQDVDDRRPIRLTRPAWPRLRVQRDHR